MNNEIQSNLISKEAETEDDLVSIEIYSNILNLKNRLESYNDEDCNRDEILERLCVPISLLSKISSKIQNHPMVSSRLLIESHLFHDKLMLVLKNELDRPIDKVSFDFVHRTLKLQYNLMRLSLLTRGEWIFENCWDFIFDQQYYRKLLDLEKFSANEENRSLQKNCCLVITALMYELLQHSTGHCQSFVDPIFDELDCNDKLDFWLLLFNLVISEISEWALWIIFIALKKKTFTRKLFSKLTVNYRLILIDILQEFVEDEAKNANVKEWNMKNLDYDSQYECFDRDIIVFLSEFFKQNISDYLQQKTFHSNKECNQEEIHLVCKICEFLLKSCSFEFCHKIIKSDKDLFRILIKLLLQLQLLAKSEASIFAVKSRLDDLDESMNGINPVFGFKRDIIGLIANCLHKNREGQDYLRESGALYALLECTRIDQNNPFIQQWCIFALRNALEANESNQKFVQNLQEQKMIYDEKLLDRIRFKKKKTLA
uniref:Ataxin-10 n=1 Tax=Sarcoptes scabiei TaxID=52283 RepID=A0A834R3E2_SARSC